MDPSLTTTQLLKRDRLGRVCSTPEQRADVIAAFERSGLKGPAFAKLAGINYQTFAGWRWAHAKRKLRTIANPTKPTFVEALLPSLPMCPSQPSTIEVFMPDGVSLRIADSSQVALAAQLLNALRTSC